MDDIDQNKLKDPPLQVFKSICEWPPAERPTVLEDTFLAVGECVYSECVYLINVPGLPASGSQFIRRELKLTRCVPERGRKARIVGEGASCGHI